MSKINGMVGQVEREELDIIIALFGFVFLLLCQSDRKSQAMEKIIVWLCKVLWRFEIDTDRGRKNALAPRRGAAEVRLYLLFSIKVGQVFSSSVPQKPMWTSFF